MPDTTPLWWSRRGDVACAKHAPVRDSAQWKAEGWTGLVAPGRRIQYQCRQCASRAVRHRRASSTPASAVILNVDDRPAALYLREQVLRSEGFTVVNAESGQRALDLIRERKPQLVLLDVYLPDVDGRDLCERINADPDLQHIPVVLISAQAPPFSMQVESLGTGGAAAFITEPAAPEALISTIRTVLARGSNARPNA